MPIQYIYVDGKKKNLKEYILSCSLCGIPAGRVQHPKNSHSINYHSVISDSKRTLILKQRPNHRMNLQKNKCTNKPILYVDSTATIKECQDFLLKCDYSFPISVGSTLITVGGAFNVGKHSAMFEEDDPFFPSYVTYVEIMDSYGQIRKISDEEILFYLRGSFGVFGIVLRLGIECKDPSFTKLSITVHNKSYKNPPQHTEGIGYISQIKKRIRISKEKVINDKKKSNNTYLGGFINSNIPPNILYSVQNFTSGSYQLSGLINLAGYLTTGIGETEKGALGDALPAVPTFDVAFTIPYCKINAFMLQYEVLINKFERYNAYPVRCWARYVPATSKYLLAYNYYESSDSLNYSYDSMVSNNTFDSMVCIVETVFSTKMPSARKLLRNLGKLMMNLNGYPHMGKTILPNWNDYLQKIYEQKIENHPKFMELLKEFDPKRIFSNKSLKNIFVSDDLNYREECNFNTSKNIFRIY